MTDMNAVIVAKSDQLNSDDLMGGPKTIRVSQVAISPGSEQPVTVRFEGDEGKPWRPCKSMSRVMVAGWGPDAKEYVGRSLTLYRDPKVKWGGMEVGGIRISHMSHIERDMVMALTATRGKKDAYKVKPLAAQVAPLKVVEDAPEFDWVVFDAEVEKALKVAIDPDALTVWWNEQKDKRMEARAADKNKAAAIATRVSTKIQDLTEALKDA